METIEQNGVRYRFFSGPYADQIDAYDRISVLIERGILDEKIDDPVVIGNSIYVCIHEDAAVEQS